MVVNDHYWVIYLCGLNAIDIYLGLGKLGINNKIEHY